MSIDLSPWRAASDLVNAIWEARRAGRTDLRPEIVGLLDHEDPTVREEAISLLFVKWSDTSVRDRLTELLRCDPDFGVRSRAASAIALTSDEGTRQSDCLALRGVVLDKHDDAMVRKASYEALFRIVHGHATTLADDDDLDEDIELDWVREACKPL